MVWLLGATLAAGVVAANNPTGEGGLNPGLVNPGHHDKPAWFKESFLDLREDVAEAQARQRRVLLYFYQDGCPYCAKLLSDNFGNCAIDEKTRRRFDVIAINMWGDRDVIGQRGQTTTEKAFAAALRVQYTPTLLFLNESGDVVLRLNGCLAPHHFDVALDFVAGRHESDGRFRDYLAAAAPVAADDKPRALPATLPHPLNLAQRGDGGQ